ncbi:hypothetical protein GCM10011607_14830 [Shewanella inventionis]|uniref:Uncharacterized protein n=1 Tax=Shewanella inventionis TaxID=1738770 RepID=A0ABQ1IZR6_9GAMM|nr:hypothetical protein GCM10011607_14830 [Shewanella inventionis]
MLWFTLKALDKLYVIISAYIQMFNWLLKYHSCLCCIYVDIFSGDNWGCDYKYCSELRHKGSPNTG